MKKMCLKPRFQVPVLFNSFSKKKGIENLGSTHSGDIVSIAPSPATSKLSGKKIKCNPRSQNVVDSLTIPLIYSLKKPTSCPKKQREERGTTQHLLICFGPVQPDARNQSSKHASHYNGETNSTSIQILSLEQNMYAYIIRGFLFHEKEKWKE